MRRLPFIPALAAAIALLTLAALGVAAARGSITGGERGHATADLAFLVEPDGSLVALPEDDPRRAEPHIRFTLHSASSRGGLFAWELAFMSYHDTREPTSALFGNAIIERAAADPAFAAHLDQMLRFAATDPIGSMILAARPGLPAEGHVTRRTLDRSNAIPAALSSLASALALAAGAWIIVGLFRQYHLVPREPAPSSSPSN